MTDNTSTKLIVRKRRDISIKPLPDSAIKEIEERSSGLSR